MLEHCRRAKRALRIHVAADSVTVVFGDGQRPAGGAASLCIFRRSAAAVRGAAAGVRSRDNGCAAPQEIARGVSKQLSVCGVVGAVL